MEFQNSIKQVSVLRMSSISGTGQVGGRLKIEKQNSLNRSFTLVKKVYIYIYIYIYIYLYIYIYIYIYLINSL